jgi:hypothetical protein
MGNVIMVFNMLVNKKIGSTSVVIIIFFPLLTIAGENCAPLYGKNGYTLNSSATAQRYSKNHIGTVAIAVLPGEDVSNNPSLLVGMFVKNDISAECFINDMALDSGGTNFTFYIAGLPIKYKGESSFGIGDIKNDDFKDPTLYIGALCTRTIDCSLLF